MHVTLSDNSNEVKVGDRIEWEERSEIYWAYVSEIKGDKVGVKKKDRNGNSSIQWLNKDDVQVTGHKGIKASTPEQMKKALGQITYWLKNGPYKNAQILRIFESVDKAFAGIEVKDYGLTAKEAYEILEDDNYHTENELFNAVSGVYGTKAPEENIQPLIDLIESPNYDDSLVRYYLAYNNSLQHDIEDIQNKNKGNEWAIKRLKSAKKGLEAHGYTDLGVYRQISDALKNAKHEEASLHVTLATGEPDQDYDHKFFDEIVKQLARAGFKGATHQEWDKYTGVYLKVPGVDRFWIKDYYSTGTRIDKNHKYEYADASLQDDDGGTYSADPGDYFMMEPDEVFEGQTLLMTKMDGTKEMIENPKKSDLPTNVAPKTFSYEKGTVTQYTIFVPENNNDEEIEVSDHNGKVDAYALIEYCKTHKEKRGSKETDMHVTLNDTDKPVTAAADIPGAWNFMSYDDKEDMLREIGFDEDTIDQHIDKLYKELPRDMQVEVKKWLNENYYGSKRSRVFMADTDLKVGDEVIEIGKKPQGTVWDVGYIETIKGGKAHVGYGSKGTGNKRMYYEWIDLDKLQKSNDKKGKSFTADDEDSRTRAEELAESYINGNIEFVRNEIGNDIDLFSEILDVLEETYPDTDIAMFRRRMRIASVVNADKWEHKNWDNGSLKKYLKTLTGDAKHKVTKCIEKIKNVKDITDPGAFCASLVDEVEGTSWRHEKRGPRKKESQEEYKQIYNPSLLGDLIVGEKYEWKREPKGSPFRIFTIMGIGGTGGSGNVRIRYSNGVEDNLMREGLIEDLQKGWLIHLSPKKKSNLEFLGPRDPVIMKDGTIGEVVSIDDDRESLMVDLGDRESVYFGEAVDEGKSLLLKTEHALGTLARVLGQRVIENPEVNRITPTTQDTVSPFVKKLPSKAPSGFPGEKVMPRPSVTDIKDVEHDLTIALNRLAKITPEIEAARAQIEELKAKLKPIQAEEKKLNIDLQGAIGEVLTLMMKSHEGEKDIAMECGQYKDYLVYALQYWAKNEITPSDTEVLEKLKEILKVESPQFLEMLENKEKNIRKELTYFTAQITQYLAIAPIETLKGAKVEAQVMDKMRDMWRKFKSFIGSLVTKAQSWYSEIDSLADNTRIFVDRFGSVIQSLK